MIPAVDRSKHEPTESYQPPRRVRCRTHSPKTDVMYATILVAYKHLHPRPLCATSIVALKLAGSRCLCATSIVAHKPLIPRISCATSIVAHKNMQVLGVCVPQYLWHTNTCATKLVAHKHLISNKVHVPPHGHPCQSQCTRSSVPTLQRQWSANRRSNQ